MSKKTILENWRVEVEPCQPFYSKRTPEDMRRACEEVKREIKRHCDVESVSVMYDTRNECEFCHRDWETEADGCPACCGEAQAEWSEQTGKPLTV